MEEEQADMIYMAVSSMLSMVLIASLFGDLLGVNVFELAKQVITKPWVIPKDIIEQYYPLWYGMEWFLLIVMLADQVYTMRYYSVNKGFPPASYTRWVSLLIFIPSFFLLILFRTATFFLLTILSTTSLVYSFMKKEEE